MSRAQKDAGRGNTRPTVKAESSSGKAGPTAFDGRSNLHAPALKQVVNKQDQGAKGKEPIAGRVP